MGMGRLHDARPEALPTARRQRCADLQLVELVRPSGRSRSSPRGEHHKARRAYLRIAGFLAQLRQTAEQLDPVQRWYRILSEALKRYLKGRQLEPPLRLAPA